MIRREALNLQIDERTLVNNYVFVEKSTVPTSKTGDGVPIGFIILTNKRFFYISVREERSTISKVGKVGVSGLKFVTKLTSSLLNSYTFGLMSLATGLVEHGISSGFNKLERKKMLNLVIHIEKEESYVISVQNIIKVEKIEKQGEYFSKPVNYIRMEIKNEYGLVNTFCIYIIDDKGNVAADNVLLEELTSLGNKSFCDTCNKPNNMKSNFCIYCGESIKNILKSAI